MERDVFYSYRVAALRRLWRLILLWSVIAWAMALVAAMEAAHLHHTALTIVCGGVAVCAAMSFWESVIVLWQTRRRHAPPPRAARPIAVRRDVWERRPQG